MKAASDMMAKMTPEQMQQMMEVRALPHTTASASASAQLAAVLCPSLAAANQPC
jgi:hypothetical protein